MQNEQKLLPERQVCYALTEPKLDRKQMYVNYSKTHTKA